MVQSIQSIQSIPVVVYLIQVWWNTPYSPQYNPVLSSNPSYTMQLTKRSFANIFFLFNKTILNFFLFDSMFAFLNSSSN